MKWVGVALLVSGLAFGSRAQADDNLLWAEVFHGDLSNDRLNPTTFDLLPGVNILAATTGFSTSEDLEYFTIKLAPGMKWTQLILREYPATTDLSFIGVVSGETFPFAPDQAQSNIGNLLGWAHFGPEAGHSNGDDIMDDMGLGFGAIGFTPPLDGPAYTFWVQQFNADTSYVLEFIATGVPEPAAWMLAAFGSLVGLSGRPRVTRRRS